MTDFRRLTGMFVAAMGLILSAPQAFAQQPDRGDEPGLIADDGYQLDPEWQKQVVYFRTTEPPGTIIVSTAERHLYLVQPGGRAIRYGIGVGRDGFQWQGLVTITNKKEWPDWTPPPEMIQRQPYLPRFMAGGPGNPLGPVPCISAPPSTASTAPTAPTRSAPRCLPAASASSTMTLPISMIAFLLAPRWSSGRSPSFRAYGSSMIFSDGRFALRAHAALRIRIMLSVLA